MTDHADTIRAPWEDVEILLRKALYPDEAVDAALALKESNVAIVDESELVALLAERQQAIDERDEALRRMDAALAKQYNANAAYEAKIQDLAQETLRNSELRAQLQQAIDALREIAQETETICPGPNHDYEAVPTRGAKIARAALLSLGEHE